MSANSDSGLTHVLTVVQQPMRARATGTGERERRAIDPCPIVELRVLGPDGTEIERTHWEHKYVMITALFDEAGTVECTAPRVAGPSDVLYEDQMIGGQASSEYHVHDLEGRYGYFFCFPDIRVRHPGRYRLRFSLLRLPPVELEMSQPTFILDHVFTEPFRVYSFKDFPGVDESTLLTKTFANQGVAIPIRNKGRLKHEDGGSDDGHN
ncbi:hypothetical protein GGH19_004881 [Coemansia sp. RSA 1807]|nr:hypothetical protein LPJ58_004350 [Coemansia sp. RSA 1591]KAJ1757808.1 hypothetical protein LPJ69_004288 [Coemansia sp. RSA 1752]KAJ1784737.1 hypothetical protein LPJ67_004216 [Coemansia sp. RSA 1938]KAJ1792089.1 hypothetical protein LPJ62_001043 [Coemansia sp. RSA 2167]KAJ2130880.1 hypothetical protein GGF48_001820 [Coemansia sp. RSA 921]KAJ2131562.1 hypothetical protein GGH17_003478 [Coemansia sp. RSA 788]KAJ2221510.1 hypothetical protein EV180_004631 [Coemansia sp. RSA 518]KAJ2240091.1